MNFVNPSEIKSKGVTKALLYYLNINATGKYISNNILWSKDFKKIK